MVVEEEEEVGSSWKSELRSCMEISMLHGKLGGPNIRVKSPMLN